MVGMQDPEKAKKKAMMMLKVGMMFMMIGFVMALMALFLEFATLKPALEQIGAVPKSVWEQATLADNAALVNARVVFFVFPPMLMTLKLVGIAFILSGIFITLVVIAKGMFAMPDRLKTALK
ncbi:MAG: hypothetical protein HY518_02850, partial [Candidatus Aenigmarchaeota archaeon]|nr:hypothetical protein [Candidatus Aenigmarchaeota archaeon]